MDFNCETSLLNLALCVVPSGGGLDHEVLPLRPAAGHGGPGQRGAHLGSEERL